MFGRVITAGVFFMALSTGRAEAQNLTIPSKPLESSVVEDAQGVRRRVVRIPLDRTGVGDWRFLNPRRPYRMCVAVSVAEDGTETCHDRPGVGAAVYLRLENLSSTRTMVVEFSDIPSKAEVKDKVVAAGLTDLHCVGDKCQAVFHIPSGLTGVDVPLAALYEAYVAGQPDVEKRYAIQFKVSLFEEETALTNPTGVFTLLPAGTKERPGETKWSTTASGEALLGPDLSGLVPSCDAGTTCGKDPVITRDNFRDNALEDHFAGTVRIGLTQSLGSRAKAEAEIQLKKGQFGAENLTTEITATKYKISVFSQNGSILSGGRYTFANPSQSIAINEAGEGITISWRALEASHIFKKEVPDDRLRRALLKLEAGGPEVGEGDHQTSIFQVRDIRLSDGGSVRVNLLALLGQQEARGLDHNYSTLGGELFVGLSRHVSATGAAYWSSRRPEVMTENGEPERRGSVFLGTVGYTKFLDKKKDEGAVKTQESQDPEAAAKERKDKEALPKTQPVDYTLTGYAGWGSGDNGATGEREDYLGQTAGFLPDVIFLGTLAPYISLDPADGRVGKGLANKRYLSGAYANHHFSPLRYLARWLQVPQEDIASQGMTVRVHHYRFNERVFGRYEAGTEANVEFRIESPKGVKYKTIFATYWPGKALSSVITRTQYAVLGTISVAF